MKAIILFGTPGQEAMVRGWKIELLTSIRQIVQELSSTILGKVSGHLTVRIVHDAFTHTAFYQGDGVQPLHISRISGDMPDISFTADSSSDAWDKSKLLSTNETIVVALLEAPECVSVRTRMLELAEPNIGRNIPGLVCVKVIE